MEYISTAQASRKWGISTSRITILAKAGRIPGVKQIGLRWMIPANAAKPADGRTKAAKLSEANEPYFRFPTFEGRDAESIFPPLNKDELQLKRAMEALYACRYAEAEHLLGNLPERAEDRYCRINALRLGCVCSFLLCDTGRFLDRYGRLTAELQQDFPRKVEMQELIHELDALLGDSSYFSGRFRIRADYAYHKSYMSHLASLCTISLFYSGSKDMNLEALTAYEFICSAYDSTENYQDNQTMHLYLGCTYAVLGMREETERHLHRALELAEKHELYYGVATEYYYMVEAFAPALADFPEEFQVRLRKYSEDLHTCYIHFTDAISMNSVFRMLLHEEYIFILYAAQGYQNKEVSRLLDISERNVQQKYSEICDMLNVNNKAELVALYHRVISINEPDGASPA